MSDKGVRSRPSTDGALGADDILGQWRRERPDLDPMPIALFGMLARVYLISRRYINGTLEEFGLTREMFDVLATLRRSGPPYQLTPTQPSRSLVLTGPGMTNRGARYGTLTLWAGGSREQFIRCTPVLESFSARILYVGGIGAGAVAKLVHNAAGYAMNLLIAEVFTAGVKAGIGPLALWEAVSAGGFGRTGTFDVLGGQFLRQRFDPPEFPLALAHKDVRLMTELAKEVEVPMRLVNLALEEMTEAVNRGWSDRDWLAGTLLQVERAGLDAADLRFSDDDVDAVQNRISPQPAQA